MSLSAEERKDEARRWLLESQRSREPRNPPRQLTYKTSRVFCTAVGGNLAALGPTMNLRLESPSAERREGCYCRGVHSGLLQRNASTGASLILLAIKVQNLTVQARASSRSTSPSSNLVQQGRARLKVCRPSTSPRFPLQPLTTSSLHVHDPSRRFCSLLRPASPPPPRSLAQPLVAALSSSSLGQRLS